MGQCLTNDRWMYFSVSDQEACDALGNQVHRCIRCTDRNGTNPCHTIPIRGALTATATGSAAQIAGSQPGTNARLPSMVLADFACPINFTTWSIEKDNTNSSRNVPSSHGRQPAIPELRMRFQQGFLAGILLLVLLSDAVAQTAAPSSPGLTARALRKEDRQVCTGQSVQQNIAGRNRAKFVRTCMADRQGERKIAARALGTQDRQMCSAQSIQQNVSRRNRAEFVRKCMADRQGERRAAVSR
jgi:hypothetical protein